MNDGDGTMPDCKVGRKKKNKEKIGNNNNDSDWESKAQHLYECSRWICLVFVILHSIFIPFGFGLSPSYSLFISFKIELSCHDNRQNIYQQPKTIPSNRNFLTWTHFANSIWVFLHIFQFNSIVCVFFCVALCFVFTRKKMNKIKFHDLCQCRWMNGYGMVQSTQSHPLK